MSSSSSSAWWGDTEAWCITLGRSQNDVLCAEKSKAWPDGTSFVWGIYNPHSFVCLSERRESCKSPLSSGNSKRSAQNQTDQGRCQTKNNLWWISHGSTTLSACNRHFSSFFPPIVVIQWSHFIWRMKRNLSQEKLNVGEKYCAVASCAGFIGARTILCQLPGCLPLSAALQPAGKTELSSTHTSTIGRRPGFKLNWTSQWLTGYKRPWTVFLEGPVLNQMAAKMGKCCQLQALSPMHRPCSLLHCFSSVFFVSIDCLENKKWLEGW